MIAVRQRIVLYARLQLLLTAALVAFLFVVFFLRYLPTHAATELIEAEIEEQRRELEVSLQKARNLPTLAAENAQLRQQLLRAKRLPGQHEWAQFVKDLMELGTRSSLKRFEYAYGGATQMGELSQLPLVLRFSGDFTAVFDFLKQVEEMPRLTRVRAIDISRQPDQPGYVSVDLTLSTFFEPGAGR